MTYGPREPRCSNRTRDAMLCKLSSYEENLSRDQVFALLDAYGRMSALRLLPRALFRQRGPLCAHATIDTVLINKRYCMQCPSDDYKPLRLWVYPVNVHLADAYASAMGRV
jgi:hypothetical protein